MIAYHLPPMSGSSGIQRTLRFAQYLPALGWQPLLLTVQPRAYEETSNDLADELLDGVVMRRAFALDAARHLSIKGRYLGSMSRPDRWVSWRFDGVRQGIRMIRQFKPDAIWSTYPIATAHLIGAELQRRTSLPWIADFRDPMAQPDYPSDPMTRKSFLAIEAQAAAQASFCAFTTPSAARDYQIRYPQAAKRVVVLENGYDEDSFQHAASALTKRAAQTGAAAPRSGGLTLLHSGIVYPSERDPTELFKALGRLKAAGALTPPELKIRFRAAVHDEMLRKVAAAQGCGDFIEVCPPIPYHDALAEMMTVDGLLIMQASNCNSQIPAKAYEYLRAGRPILGLTDPEGDTCWALRRVGVQDFAPLNAADPIAEALLAFVAKLRAGTAVTPGTQPGAQPIAQASRQSRTAELRQLLQAASGA